MTVLFNDCDENYIVHAELRLGNVTYLKSKIDTVLTLPIVVEGKWVSKKTMVTIITLNVRVIVKK